MCFSNINHEELHTVIILLMEVVETHGPLHIGWSGIATENQRYRLPGPEAGEANGVLTVYVVEFEIRGDIPDFRCKGIVLLLPSPAFSP
jgi:hypothetical protein